MRILLVEDNFRLAELVAEGLGDEGFVVDAFPTLDEARASCAAVSYDLVVLDLGLPDGDGLDFIRFLRRSNDKTPVLVITARGGLNDRITGLDSGADDYLVKPFETAELAARCRALLRRPGASLGTFLSLADLTFDSGTREVTIGEATLRLSPKELNLLECLMRRGGHVVQKGTLEEAIYSLASEVTPNALEAVVSRLRRRLAQGGAAVELHTAHGIGYMLAAKSDAVGRDA
jgi:DNA-binding response OmpR family regulator